MFANKKPLLALLLPLACFPLAGCGSPHIEGTVTLNGEPVDGGVIMFLPPDQPNAPDKANAPITGGKYSISSRELTPGNYRVSIIWQKKTGKKVDTSGDAGVKMDEVHQVVPKQYNTETTLTREVKSGSNTLSFELTGPPPPKPGSGPARPRIND